MTSEVMAPGSPAPSASRNSCWSSRSCRHTTLQLVSLQASIQGAARQPQSPGGVTDVAVARHRLLYEMRFHFLETHVFESRRRGPVDAQPEIRRAYRRAARHQHRALDGVVQLANVAGPAVIHQDLQRGGIESRDVL